MKFENLRSEKNGNRHRVVATISYEDCDRPTQEVYFETDEEFAQDLSCNPHAFLAVSTIAAMHQGEKRISIDEEICPEFRNGLNIAMRMINQWYTRYGIDHKPVKIEARAMVKAPPVSRQARAGFFFSGGIDSLATLSVNRLNFPLEHSSSFKDGFLVHGLQPEIDKIFDGILSSLSVLAQKASVTLVPVSTNIRYLEDDWSFWTDEFEGAVFSAVAHAFHSRINSVTLASSFDVVNLHPHGSHPLLDPNYSSSDLLIKHGDVTLSRLAKTKLVADWDDGLHHVRVCNLPNLSGKLNCGECEKCVRTKLALVAHGKFEQVNIFSYDAISEELVLSAVGPLTITNYPFYPELIFPLKKKGRHDLVRAIEHKMAEFEKRQMKRETRRLFSEFDRIYLNDALKKMKKFIKS